MWLAFGDDTADFSLDNFVMFGRGSHWREGGREGGREEREGGREGRDKSEGGGKEREEEEGGADSCSSSLSSPSSVGSPSAPLGQPCR